MVAAEASQLPAHLQERMSEHSGMGVSTRAEDNLIPIITMIQKNSPQVEKRDPKYIEGAEAGFIWMRGAEYPLINGEEGFLFQPCFFDQDWVEWIPRKSGGGFVGRHRAIPADVIQVEEASDDGKMRKKWVRPSGNEVIETRYHVGRVFDGDDRHAYVIPLQSSGHTVSKQWMFEMNNKKLPNGEKAPSFAKVYRIRSKYRQNAAGSWYVLDPSDEGWVGTEEDYEAGLALNQAFDKGEAKMDENQFSSDSAPEGQGGGEEGGGRSDI